MMRSALRFLFRLPMVFEWRDISTAPLHQEVELAVINDRVRMFAVTYFRRADGWYDAETLSPVSITATHWRYRQQALTPLSCC